MKQVVSSTEPISSQFVESVAAGIAYWRVQTREINDQTLSELDNERHNLYRAVEYGLKLKQTWRDTAVVSLQAFPLVERRGYWTDWIPVLERAVSLCPDEESELKCKLLNRLGQSYRLNRQLDLAIEVHHQSESIGRQSGNDRTLAEAYCHLGEAYLRRRDYEQAERYGREALSRFEQMAGADEWMIAVLNTLGEAARFRGDMARAEERFDRAITLARQNNHSLQLVRLLSNQALNFQETGQYRDALDCLTEAGSILAETANELDKVSVQNNIGLLYYKQGQWQEAEMAFHRADTDYLRRSPNFHLQAQVANNIGNTLIKQAKFESAVSYLRQAVDLWLQADDKLELANTSGSLAEALAGQGNTNQALAHFEEALALLAHFPDDTWAVRLRSDFRQQQLKLAGGEKA